MHAFSPNTYAPKLPSIHTLSIYLEKCHFNKYIILILYVFYFGHFEHLSIFFLGDNNLFYEEIKVLGEEKDGSTLVFFFE